MPIVHESFILVKIRVRLVDNIILLTLLIKPITRQRPKRDVFRQIQTQGKSGQNTRESRVNRIVFNPIIARRQYRLQTYGENIANVQRNWFVAVGHFGKRSYRFSPPLSSSVPPRGLCATDEEKKKTERCLATVQGENIGTNAERE